MSTHRWFLPETPDVLGMLREQAAVTVEGINALVAWAHGDAAAPDRIRDCQHRADARKRELRTALTVAFTTPLEPEDLFELSRGLDRVLASAKNTVREAEVMGTVPDAPIAEMAAYFADGVRCLADAFAALAAGTREQATQSADGALDSQRHIEPVYRAAMSALITIDDLHEVAARRELYRRLARTSDGLVDVAERVWYAMLKDS